MKKELIETFETVKTQRLINLKNDELVTLVNNLIDTNLIPNGTFSYKSNGVEFSACADFVPKGSNQIRPSGIKLNFDEYKLISLLLEGKQFSPDNGTVPLTLSLTGIHKEVSKNGVSSTSYPQPFYNQTHSSDKPNIAH